MNNVKTHLDLFSGIGAFSLAARWAGFETLAFCESSEYARLVLRKNFPGVTIHEDIKKLDGGEYTNVRLITGGYPCQPYSTLGKRSGAEDDRHLWSEMHRVIARARPTYVLAENVFGHVSLGLDSVLSDLESIGYSARPLVIPALSVGTIHIRERVYIIAYSSSGRLETTYKAPGPDLDDCFKIRKDFTGIEPGVHRADDGISKKLHRFRIHALGNSLVPQVAFEILRHLD